jgi:tetratricopeptide (TPR) repeat protein
VAYFNELTGGTKGAYGWYETDPLTNCSREAIEWLVKHTDADTKPMLIGSNIELESLKYYADKYPNKFSYVWMRDYNKYESDWDYAIISTRGMSQSQQLNGSFPPKGTIHSIRVGGAILCVIVKKQNNYMAEGYKLYNNADYEKAIPWLEKAASADPLNEEALTLLGSCYINTGQFSKGIDWSVKAINFYNENYIAFNNLGVAEFYNKNYEKAIQNYHISLYHRCNWRSTLLNLGKTYYFLKVYDSAIYYYGEANKYFQKDEEIYLYLAEVHKALNNTGLAIETYRQLLVFSPGNKTAVENLKWLQKATNNNAWAADMEKAKKFSTENLHDSAIHYLNRVIEKSPDNLEAIINRGVAWFMLGDLDRAISDFDYIIGLDSNLSDPWLKKGQVLLKKGMINEALECLNKALQYNPSSIEALNERGHLYVSAKDYKKAFEDYSASLSLNRYQPKILYARAYVYAFMKKFAQGFPDIDEALRQDPRFGDGYLLRSMLYYETGNFKKALEDAYNAQKCGVAVEEEFLSQLKKAPGTK